MSYVGYCYRNGIGISKDLQKANYWYQMAKNKMPSEWANENFNNDDDVKKFLVEEKYPLSWISYKEFIVIEKIGQGRFATVFHAEWLDNKHNIWKNVVLKLLHGSKSCNSEFIKELKAYYDISSKYPSLLKCHGISKVDSGDYILVLKYVLRGSLRKNLCAVSQMKWMDKLKLLHCIAFDLQIIHSHELIHRDLHSGNILQDHLHGAYIADLGLSILTNIASNAERRGIYGVLPYIAPEVLDIGYYSTASNIYSFGIIMWEILYGRPVSYNREFGQRLQIEICRNDLQPTIVENMPLSYINIMKQCWERDLLNRPSATKICEILTQWINDEILLEQIESYELFKNIKITPILTYLDDLYKGVYIEIPEPINANGDIEILKFLQNTSLQWIPFKDLQIIKEIGKGGFATIFLAKCNLNGSTENVALKFLRGSRNNFEALLKELNVYYNIRCKEPTFLQCYGISKDINATNDYILIMQYAPMGSLRQNLRKVAKIVWKEKLELLSYIALDLKMMHSHGIIHRDLHSGNILQNNLYNAYIGDLGLAETVNKALAKSNGIYGAFPYIAPEVLRKREYTLASDIYSFGIIMWEVSSGRLAFSDKNHDLYFLTEVCNGLRPTVAKEVPQYYVDLMKRCWDNDPEKRPMASEIYEVIKSWKNNYEILLKFNKFETLLEESGAIHHQAIYTSRFISLKELVTINSQAVYTNGIINDDNKIKESQENNKIIKSQEDNLPIERMNKLMLSNR